MVVAKTPVLRARQAHGPARPRNEIHFPAASGGALTPRPVADIAPDRLQATPIECLPDTGALRTKMIAGITSLAGIEPSGDFTEESSIAGVKTVGAMARINRGYLEIEPKSGLQDA